MLFQDADLTLHDDVRSGVNGVHVVAGEAGVLAPVSLVNVLDVEPPRGGDVDAGIAGQWAAVSSGPRHPRVRLTCSAALESHALSNQHLRVLGLDHKTGPSCGLQSRGTHFLFGY